MDPSPLCIMESSEHLEQLKAHYSIKEVVQTGKQVGHGAYGYVEEVEVSGALCALRRFIGSWCTTKTLAWPVSSRSSSRSVSS